jgi:FMN phosphatase YigB (HAD superfamily)
MTAAERQRFAHTVYYIWICIEAAKRGEDIQNYAERLDTQQVKAVGETMMYINALSSPGFRSAVLSDFPSRWQPMITKLYGLHGLVEITEDSELVYG